MTFLRKFYLKTLKYDLVNCFNLNNNLKLPKVKALILNFKTSNIKDLFNTLLKLKLITKQQPKLKTKKPHIGLLTCKESRVTACKLTIKKSKLFSFLKNVIPEVFNNLYRQLNIEGTFNFNKFQYEIKNTFNFSELKINKHLNDFNTLFTDEIIIVTTPMNRKKSRFFFKSFSLNIKDLKKDCFVGVGHNFMVSIYIK